jgi:hypothetical protein
VLAGVLVLALLVWAAGVPLVSAPVSGAADEVVSDMFLYFSFAVGRSPEGSAWVYGLQPERDKLTLDNCNSL